LNSASGLFGSSGCGISDNAIVSPVVRNPTVATSFATVAPPGTRITSGPAGSRCSLIIAANKYKYGIKYVITPMLTRTS